MPIASLFWCAGCQGSIYPMGGHVATHIGGVQASTLITQRMTAKMHRQLVTFTGAGSAGLCGYYPLPIMDKTHYKLQMVYPVPATAREAGQCCQPYGRTTMIWGAASPTGLGRGLLRTRSSARGTAVPARTETRAIVAAACALGLLAAGIARPGAALARRRRHRAGTESPPFPAPIVSVPNRCPRRRA